MLHIFKALLVTFALLAANVHAAKTERLDTFDNTTVYLETDSIRKSKDTISYWLVFDFKAEQTYNGKAFKSIASEIKANCSSNKSENALSVFFKGSMGKGEFLLADANQKYGFDIPSALLDKYSASICTKK